MKAIIVAILRYYERCKTVSVTVSHGTEERQPKEPGGWATNVLTGDVDFRISFTGVDD